MDAHLSRYFGSEQRPDQRRRQQEDEEKIEEEWKSGASPHRTS